MTNQLRPALRAMEAELRETPLPPGSLARLRSRIDRPTRVWPMFAMAVACVIIVLALGYWALSPRRVGGFTIATNHGLHMTASADGTIDVRDGDGVIVPPNMRVRLGVSTRSQLRVENSHTIRVLAGTVDFVVAPVAPGDPPLRVLVSHGAIEVVGTEFSVNQRAGGGAVHLRSGSIRFVVPDGRVIALQPGQELAWPVFAAITDTTSPTSEPPTPARDRSPGHGAPREHPSTPAREPSPTPMGAPTVGQDQLMQELDALRIRGNYPELARRIAAALPHVTSATVRESLSYERCDILAFRLEDTRGACRCFAEHLDAFPNTRYATKIADARKVSGCE